MLPCGTPQLRVRADDSLPLTLHRSKCALPATHKIYVHILRSKRGKTPEMFLYKTSAVRNTCSKGNINRSKCALPATHKIYVHILRSKRGKTPEMFSIKRVRFVILARKGISIVASVLCQQHTRY